MGYRILVVDDEPFLRRILTYLLTGAGYRVECAEDGHQALEKLSGPDLPDLLITDLMMPGLSGTDLVRKLRQEREFGKPVLVLTARGQRMDEVEARASGADAFMTKPFRSQELLKRVDALLESVEGRRATGTTG